jgi:hypothetical protein
LYLHTGQDGELTGYSEEETFGASDHDVSFGRYQKSTGEFNFVAMSAVTPESANIYYPKVGPVIINEIMYNPPEGGSYEYVELYNMTDSAVALEEYDNQQHIYVPWKFTDGIDFTFPPGISIPAHSYLIVAKDGTLFGTLYTVPSGIQVLGPYDGQLDNGGEKLEISQPGDEVGGIRYYIRVDRVTYSDGSHPAGDDPWPLEPDGTGKSLRQKTPDTVDHNYGNDVINWMADDPSPGT